MLEIRNITKVYRSKTGESVKALDNVSIQFPETGMVFLLGKSGSGKSTLLNVIGGLDSADSGEFIIKGKSSKDFVGSDFDAYRNTFIGFIFQEYNVLDEFSVGANIGLALELQGKKATSEAITSILAQVDLVGYANRKPNELSGGQKQRVAIARALVKDPQIIMADEPTGALDSNTGKQIFDTLKELSKTKLVLIVSHDRDFAEKYADRIIELADGQVIEDVTKHAREAEKISDGVHRINDHILRIESGYRLTAKDLDMINAYLAQNHGDVLLSGDNRVNEELRSAVGISKEGHSTVFERTKPEEDIEIKSYEKRDSKFIRSRLPMKNAVKIGASGLKHKKFRLFMTILLSFISFAMFGLASTVAAYENISSATRSMIDSNVRNASVTVTVRHTVDYGDGDVSHWYNDAGINEEDIAYLNAETGLNFVPVYTGSPYAYGGGFSLNGQMPAYEGTQAFNGQLTGFVDLSFEQMQKTGFALVGEWPDAKGEIVISEFLFRQFKAYGYTDGEVTIAKDKLTMDNNAETGIIGKKLILSGNGFWKDMIQIGGMQTNGAVLTIVGVVDTGFDYTRYEAFLPKDKNEPQMGGNNDTGLVDMVLQNELNYELSYGFHALAFTTADTVTAIAAAGTSHYIEVGTYMSGWNAQLQLVLTKEVTIGGEKEETYKDTRTMYRVAKIADLANLGGAENVEWLDGRTDGTLKENEILISSQYKDWFRINSAEVTLSEARLNALIALCGEENWNKADPENVVSLYDRVRRAAATAYMIESLEKESGLKAKIEEEIQNKEFAGDALAYWQDMWFNQGTPGYPWYIMSDNNEPNLNFDQVEELLWQKPELLAFVEEFMGIDLPDDMDHDRVRELFHSLTADFYVEDLTHTFQLYELYDRLRDMYVARELETHQPWLNDKMIELLIGAKYAGIDSIQAWNALGGEQQWQMECFYRDWYISDDRFAAYYEQAGYIKPTYTYQQYNDLGMEILMHMSGMTMDDMLKQITTQIVEQNYETQSEKVLSELQYSIAGFFQNSGNGDVFVSDTMYAYYQEWNSKIMEENTGSAYKEDVAVHKDGIWSFAIAPMPSDAAVIEKLATMHYAEDGTVDLKYQLNSAVMATLGSFDEIIEVVAQVFFWVGLALAVFSAFLLMNFIATSISYKKREIGILRAVGARSSDVFKIFFSEAFIIAFINFLLAMAASLTTVIILNNYMRTQGINITLLSFGIPQALLMLAISVFVAAAASFLPVYSIARKKPVDAIKDR